MASSSTFELNDTLQITKQQWFPLELDINKHLKSPYNINDFEWKIFDFKNKNWLRNFVVPPVRCFLVENIDGKRIYRWLCHILEIKLDYINKITSGKYKIIKIFEPKDIKKAFEIVDWNKDTNYFS